MPKFVQFLLAILVTLAINLLVWLIAFNLASITASHRLPLQLEPLLSVLLFGPGLGQFIYILPVSIYLVVKRRFTWFQGIVVGATVTLLLNGSFWVLVIPVGQ